MVYRFVHGQERDLIINKCLQGHQELFNPMKPEVIFFKFLLMAETFIILIQFPLTFLMVQTLMT